MQIERNIEFETKLQVIRLAVHMVSSLAGEIGVVELDKECSDTTSKLAEQLSQFADAVTKVHIADFIQKLPGHRMNWDDALNVAASVNEQIWKKQYYPQKVAILDVNDIIWNEVGSDVSVIRNTLKRLHSVYGGNLIRIVNPESDQ